MEKVLKGRLALITGASRGIGASVAQRFASEGAHLILVARTQGGLEKTDDKIRAAGGKATLVPMDLTDGNAIDDLAATIAKRFGKIDILIGNAAVLGPLSPMSHYSPETWDHVFKVNFHANWRLIRDFDLQLRQSDAGRALFVTSGVARVPRAYWGPYAASKAALEKMIKDWSVELKETNVRANIIDPGIVRTAMRKQAYPGEDAGKNPHPKKITQTFVDLASKACNQNGEVVSASIN